MSKIESTDISRRGITPSIRSAIFPPGEITYCTYCEFVASEVDHIIPRSRGGGLDLENLTPACRECNAEKSDLTIDEWIVRRQSQGKPWPIPSYFDRVRSFVEEHKDRLDAFMGDDWLQKWPGGYENVRRWLMKARDLPATGVQVEHEVTK